MSNHSKSASAERVASRYAEGKKPPNLRESKDGLRSCATCSAFNAVEQSCSDYANASVEASQTCDTWHAS